MANTGGGIIVFGADNKGQPVPFDETRVLDRDPKEFTDKIKKYTGVTFDAFEIVTVERGGTSLPSLLIEGRTIPIVFTSDGNFNHPSGETENAFRAGTVYYRQGAQSIPGDNTDIRESIERAVDEVRDRWLNPIRKVVEAPIDQEPNVVLRRAEIAQTGKQVQLSDDPDAEPAALLDPDDLYPYTTNEAVDEVNKRLDGEWEINPYDVVAIKEVHDIPDREDFFYKPKQGAPQYSDEFIDWVEGQFQADSDFFEVTRNRYYKLRYD